MSLKLSDQIAPGYEPIAGYTLEEKIGEGGFGEVWRCNAPGGLKKAVKFVFGANDAKRGERELKSLERIKGVHHPFLLTLERFGVVNSQLVIVTELADGSLEDILKRHIDRGSCGIPRAALLSYLHDAADALDYLHGSYQLQHLDIKPGNLLMVGGHVKVGDFGLLKDLREADHSIIGGLTPIYAPPELFDGRPSMNSDQYSLAVMYQELLTGTRPFAGRTIAQLATQHVHAAPNLEPLPPADRPAVAKALEKDPERRFESCKEFVEALRVSKEKPERVVRSSAPAGRPQNATVEDLPSLQADSRILSSRVTGHALVVAIGGVGGECLHELRDRVATLHSACPLDLHSILIDTDMQTIHAARLAEASDRIPPATILHTPLKTPQEYRTGATHHLKSISRRWIYNVPRSGSTEGMRPLGRLAMIDHAEKIDNGLREAIDHLAAVCGERVPSIYVIGSISGGTGSGMLPDIAPRLRVLLDEAGLEHAPILPLCAAVSMKGNPHQNVSLHDTHAALSEFRHYMLSGNSYPGDTGVKWPSVPAVRNPLRDAYVILEGDSSDPNYHSAVSTIVDYLWADATGASELLAQARKSEIKDARMLAMPMLRSVGVSRLKCLRALEENLLAPSAVRHLLLRWLGRPVESKEIAGPLAERLWKRSNLGVNSISREVFEVLGCNQNEITSQLQSIVSPLEEASLQDPDTIEGLLLATLESRQLTEKMRRAMAERLVLLRRELAVRLQDGRIDVTSALQAVQRLGEACQQAARQHSAAINVEIDSADCESASDDLCYKIEAAERLAADRLAVIAKLFACDSLKRFSQSLQVLHSQLTEMAICLARAVRCVPGDQKDTENPWDEMPQEIRSRFEPVLDFLHKQTASTWLIAPLQQPNLRLEAEEMASRLVAECLPVIEDIIDQHRATSVTVSDESDTRTRMVNSNHSVGATQETLSTMNDSQTATQSMTRMSRPQSSGLTSTQVAVPSVVETQTISTSHGTIRHNNEQITVEAAVTAARPQLLQCGGRQRLILLVGSEKEREGLEAQVQAAHNGSLTTVVVPGIAPILVHEAQQIKIDDVLARLELVAGGDTQVSRRLHARNDVTWATN